MEKEWIKILAAVAPLLLLLILLVIFLRRCCSSKQISKTETTLQSGIAKLHLHGNDQRKNNPSSFHNLRDLENKRKTNYYVFKRGLSVKPLFNWSDHPNLVSEAVEHGWSRFGFSGYMSTSSSSTRSVLLGLCAVGDQGLESEAEISWEVCNGSSDFMQKINLNSNLKKGILGISNLSSSSVIRTSLPLPGPCLGNSSFPQEAYFEITILSIRDDKDGDDEDEDGVEVGLIKQSKKKGENEKTKLIQEKIDLNSQSDSLNHESNRFEDQLKVGSKEEMKKETVMALGLTLGGTLPSKLPGSYPGSIGFSSNGAVYQDGMKLMFDDQKATWATKEKVIGCGFDPEQKKVFFTLDSELVQVIYCKSEEFGSPLYPTLATNVNATVLVNFGQSSFHYEPANAQRTPNPCFLGPISLGYEDSKELFSMGRIDSHWLDRCTTNNGDSHSLTMDMDGDSEADFIEIALDNWGKSPSTYRSNEV